MKRSKTEARTTAGDLAKPYEPTRKELDALADMRRRREEAPLPPMTFSKEEGEGEHILRAMIAHSDPEVATAALQKALGQPRQEGLDHHLLQLSKVASDAQQPGTTGYGVAYNAAIQAVAGIAPRDAVESMLAVQMALVFGWLCVTLQPNRNRRV